MCRLLLIVIIALFLSTAYGMTRPQLKKTMTVTKKQCLPKVGVSEDKVSQIEQGVFIEDPKVMCYIACVYKALLVVKNNKLDVDLISKQVDILYPPELKQPVKDGVTKCMPIQDNYSDMGEGIFYATKCLYDFDPPSFVFP